MENARRESERRETERAELEGNGEEAAATDVIARRKRCAAEGAGLSHYVPMDPKA